MKEFSCDYNNNEDDNGSFLLLSGGAVVFLPFEGNKNENPESVYDNQIIELTAA